MINLVSISISWVPRAAMITKVARELINLGISEIESSEVEESQTSTGAWDEYCYTEGHVAKCGWLGGPLWSHAEPVSYPERSPDTSSSLCSCRVQGLACQFYLTASPLHIYNR